MSLLLIFPNLRPLLIFAFPFYSHLLSLLRWWRSIALHAPVLLSFPVFTILPPLPVPLESVVINSFIIPGVPVPGMHSVMPSPSWIYIKIKSWNTLIIDPAAVIVA